VTANDPSAAGTPGLPERRVSLSQLVAYNMAAYRKVAGLSQQELGELLGGWSAASVSAAERSWDSRRVKRFDADELMQIASVLGVPLIALFLPPEDSGTAVRYVLGLESPEPGADEVDIADLLPYLLPSLGEDSPVMDAVRQHIIAAGYRLADETLDRARREVDDVLTIARREAEQLTGDARERAESLERDVQERYREAMGEVCRQREDMERRVDELRAFEREYRTRLQSLLEGGLRELWGDTYGSGTDRAIEEARKRWAEAGSLPANAVLLKSDGTYDVIQFMPEAQEERSEPDVQGRGW